MLICQSLRGLDKENGEFYAAEISTLQKRAAIRKAIRTVDSSKIYIDTDGIRSSFDDAFKESFERYCVIQKLDPERQISLPANLSKVLVLSQESFDLFKKLFLEIRGRFLSSNAFGLDSYLSVRIRHGTLAGQIRNPFERYGLVTRRDSGSGQYESNDRWVEEYPPYIFREIDAAFGSLSNDVDIVIESVKSEWVQIRSDEHPTGFFNFDYSESELLKIWLRWSEIDDFSSFVDEAFGELWARAEQGLAELRGALTTNLREILGGSLDKFETTVGGHYRIPPLLGHAIAECRTAVQNDLNAIAEWFRRGSDSNVVDFEPVFAIEAVLEIVRNTFSVPFEVDIGGHFPHLIRGSAFPSFLDLLYILLENIIRHSRPGLVNARIRLGESSNRLILEIANSISTAVDSEELEARMPSLVARAKTSEFGAAVRREGGSGFYKLGKIVAHDLRCRNWDIEIKMSTERWFVVILNIDTSELMP